MSKASLENHDSSSFMTKWFNQPCVVRGAVVHCSIWLRADGVLMFPSTNRVAAITLRPENDQRINEMVLVSSILNYLRQARTMRATSTLLHSMDDHLLQDIGVRRDQIDSLIAENREIKNKRAAAERENRRKSYPAISGRGLSAQH